MWLSAWYNGVWSTAYVDRREIQRNTARALAVLIYDRARHC